ncbi:MAG: class I SAM-dependent methyltransferase [Patescibacteria group bacterium]
MPEMMVTEADWRQYMNDYQHIMGISITHRALRDQVAFLVQKVDPVSSVLVLGAGPGLESRTLVDTLPGIHLLGLEALPQAVEAARTLLSDCDRARFVQADLNLSTWTRLVTKPLDAAVCVNVYYILKNPQFIHQVYEVLRPGGRFVMVNQARPDEKAHMAAQMRWLEEEATVEELETWKTVGPRLERFLDFNRRVAGSDFNFTDASTLMPLMEAPGFRVLPEYTDDTAYAGTAALVVGEKL